ncbi:MAG: DUF4037 domain-containing protein [Anaerolineae bacterium]
MPRDVAAYFEDTLFPFLAARFPEAAREMSLQIHGSYGLGIADEYSDLDAILYLDDPLWRREGRAVQLALEHDAPRFLSADSAVLHEHAQINVWPHSWLGDMRGFLEDGATPPWDKVSPEGLLEVQRNLVLRDPQGIFARLREATDPEKAPEWFWKKLLIQAFSQVDDGLLTYGQLARRGLTLEAAIIGGQLVQGLMQTGLLLCRRYYPWPTHLRWAFEELGAPVAPVLPLLDTLAGAESLDARLAAARMARAFYGQAVVARGLLTEEMLANLVWADRLKAWQRADWYAYIVDCRQRAEAAGYPAQDMWIYSLWK